TSRWSRAVLPAFYSLSMLLVRILARLTGLLVPGPRLVLHNTPSVPSDDSSPWSVCRDRLQGVRRCTLYSRLESPGGRASELDPHPMTPASARLATCTCTCQRSAG